MFDPKFVSLGIAPIGWCNDDMPELGAENTFQQTVSEMALAGFTGCEIGNKYPTDPAELKKALDLRGMRIASRWYSSFILTRPMEEEEKDFIANLDFLEAVGANRINVSEQSYSIQGKVDVPILTGGHKHVMDDAEWDRLCKGLNRLGQIAAQRGFKLCFHHHMGTVVQTSEETDRMMANTDPRYVFLCYDTGHFTFAGEDPLAMLKKYVDRVGHVHLKDMRLPVVEEARTRGLSHEEYHSQVQYVVAHGISSMVEGEKVLIGSAHFVFEDEGCRVPEGEDEKFRTLSPAYSHLYLCIAGELAAVICIHDPLRREARDAVAALHACGIGKVVMMTGDNRQTAQAVARAVGVDAVYAEVLPEDKAAFIRSEKAAGHTVIMVGDGVNDSPALSEADAGVAISTGAAIAREIADITIASEDLFELVTLRRLSQALMARIHRNYRFIVGFNLSLILLGVAGLLPPTTSALLHNMSTLGISLKSMTDLGPELPSPTPAER